MNRIRNSRQKSAWLWLAVVIVAVAAYGCGEAESPPDEGATAGGPPDMGGPPPGPPQRPAEKPDEEAKPEDQPLPEDISEWVKEHYYQAKRKHDPRLRDAVAYLGEHFAGTDGADSAAQLLTNLLEKSEEPEPDPRQQPGRQPGGYPPMGSAGMGPPEMESPAMSPEEEGSYEEEGGYEDDGAAAATESDEEGSYEELYRDPDGMGSGARLPGAPARMQMQGSYSGLVAAIVQALGVNDSATAKQTLKQVAEGTFETDDNRTATLTTVETLVAHLCSEYEEILFRCLTAPEKLRALGKSGQSGQAGRSPYGSGPYGQYGSGYPSTGGRTGAGPLTAEELQRHTFAVMAPVASEEFRVKLARHLVNPNTVQEDHDLFGGYLREMDPDNLAAQIVLYLDRGTDDETKQTVEENFVAYGSDAMAGILGVPAEQRAAASARRSSRERRGRGPGSGPPGMYPGMDLEEGAEEHAEEMGSAEHEEAMRLDEDPGGPMSGPPGRPRGSGRPSRYDAARDQSAASRRPSRYDASQPGAREAGPGIGQPEDPDLPYRLARQLWGSQMAKLLENRLNGIGSLEGNAQLVLLASTVPVDSTRATLHQMLKRNWQDGPNALESAGLLDDVVSDPGFLTLVKMLPRKSPEPEVGPGRPTGRTRTGRSGTRPDRMSSDEMDMGPSMPRDQEEEYSGPPGRMMPGARRPGQARPEAKGPEEAWMFTSEDLVRVLSERFLAAGRAGAGAAPPQPEGEEPPHGLPFELRDDAMVVGEYHLDWPGEVGDKLSGVPLGGLRIHYVRAEQTAKLSTMESYYKRQLGSHEIRPVQNGTWLDSVYPVPDTDWKRSIDVMCTATVPAGEEFDKKAEVPVTMDVLCIDIKDPAPTGEGG